MLLAAHQVQYLPYPGVIDKIDRADVFVFQDDLQYVKQEWQNRNRIRTVDGWQWLTIPIHSRSTSLITEVYPAHLQWIDKHKRIIANHYSRSKYLDRLAGIWKVGNEVKDKSLAVINYQTALEILEILGIKTKIILQSSLNLTEEECKTPDARLISLCKRLGCDSYLSGSGGKDYMNLRNWEYAGISIEWQAFRLPRYIQMFPAWIPDLSVIDLILCTKEPLKHIRDSRESLQLYSKTADGEPLQPSLI